MRRNLYFWTSIFFLVTAVVTAFLGIQKIQRISEKEAEGSTAMIVCSILLMVVLSVFYFVLSIKVQKRNKESMQIFMDNYNFLMDRLKKHEIVRGDEVHSFGYQTCNIVTGDYPEEFKANADYMLYEVIREAMLQEENRSKTENIWVEIVRTLNEKKLTIATMESCTGGGIANAITNISGASAVLHESYVTYCNGAKINLGVPAKVIEEHTVYSEETAIAMAKAVVKLAKSDVGVGVTGQLGRIDPNNPVEELNCVWFAVAKGENILAKKINVPDTARKFQKEFILYEIATEILKIIP